MLSLELTRTELKALDALLSDQRWLDTINSRFGAWFPKQISKVKLKARSLAKQNKLNNPNWQMGFKNRISIGKKEPK